jgi:UDP-glucose 4-epimerase
LFDGEEENRQLSAVPDQVIITGGNGYLGACTAEWLRRKGLEPILVDNFLTSSSERKLGRKVHQIDLASPQETERFFSQAGNVKAVFHFAALAIVPDSCQNPGAYFQNNINATLNVAEACSKFKVPYLIHSSSCAVYGDPQTDLLSEAHPRRPHSPYGESKRISEQIIDQYRVWKGLSALNLRYFNPAGALVDAKLGEQHEPETHLIPRIVECLSQGKEFSLFGDDYPTPDGTCIRDFIHVQDLAEAHFRALGYLEKSQKPEPSLNVGSGTGYSVCQVIKAAQSALGKTLQVKTHSRRQGDPPKLVADTKLASRALGWSASLTLEQMILDHWKWFSTRV